MGEVSTNDCGWDPVRADQFTEMPLLAADGLRCPANYPAGTIRPALRAVAADTHQ